MSQRIALVLIFCTSIHVFAKKRIMKKKQIEQMTREEILENFNNWLEIYESMTKTSSNDSWQFIDWFNVGTDMSTFAKTQEQLEQSEGPFYRALALDSTSTKVLVNLGTLLGRQGKFSEAIQYLEIAVKLDPYDQLAKRNLDKAKQFRLHQSALKGGTSDGDPRPLTEKKKMGTKTIRISLDEVIQGTGIGGKLDTATRQAILDSIHDQDRKQKLANTHEDEL